MPVWSLEELKQLQNVPGIHATICGLSDDSLTVRYNLCGGIPRYIFENDWEAVLSRLDVALAKCDLRISPDIMQWNDIGKVSHLILHLKCNTEYKCDGVIFASQFVAQKYYKHLEAQTSNSPLMFLIDSRNHPSVGLARGQIFELWAHQCLCRGGTFKIKELNSVNAGPESELKREKMKQSSFSSMNQLSEKAAKPIATPPLYLVPDQCNFTAVDSIAGNRGFQMTVRKNHPISMLGLKTILSAIKTERFELYFVVPKDVYDEPDAFQKVQSYKTQQKKTATGDMKGVTQYVLCLPLEAVLPDKA